MREKILKAVSRGGVVILDSSSSYKTKEDAIALRDQGLVEATVHTVGSYSYLRVTAIRTSTELFMERLKCKIGFHFWRLNWDLRSKECINCHKCKKA